MTRRPNEKRIAKVSRSLLALGCDGWRPVELNIRRIAKGAGVEYEEAKTTLKTLLKRGWIQKQSLGPVGFYSIGNSAPTCFREGWRKIMEPNAPTHHDALVAASFRAEANAKEIAKLAKQVRGPKGLTEYKIAQDALRRQDNLETELDAMVGHAARHCGLDDQGDLVDEAEAKADEQEDEQEEAKEEVVDVVAEPVGDEDGAPEEPAEDRIGAGPLGLEFQPVPADGEDEEAL